jgi:opacity protein-like surface antigen
MIKGISDMKNTLAHYSTSKLVAFLLFVTLIVAPSLTMAKEIYYGASLASIELTDDEGPIDKISFTTLYGRLGAKWSENISGEFRLGLASSEEKQAGQLLEMKSFGGLYVKVGAPLSETFYPYAIIGKTRGKLGISTDTSSVTKSSVTKSSVTKSSVTKSDTSFGFGADVKIFESVAINLEYINYIDKPVNDFAGFSLGLTFDL